MTLLVDDPVLTRERAHCAACDGVDLAKHFLVGTELDEQGLIPTTDAYGTALDDFLRCRDCGHMQLVSAPAEADLLSLYSSAESGDYVEEEAGQRRTARKTLETIEGHVGVGRLLDLGCWVGYLLDEARTRGWEVTGVEPSDFASAFARDELGLPVIHGDLFGADLPARRFDAIVLGDVIEHLVDPAAALRRIAELLAPGGVLYMALPDAGSWLARRMGARWWSVIPTHVQQFNRASMAALLERQGYEPLQFKTAPKTFSAKYYLGRLVGYSPKLASTLVRIATVLRVASIQCTPDFRDRMGVVARGPSEPAKRATGRFTRTAAA